ncbi:hypothetical protein RAS1_16240 [Phycisphaerae bacterium RAS1]|nr:hypothetical protein RAS1_16240 [Phycisphaerae bacterium RAS1]
MRFTGWAPADRLAILAISLHSVAFARAQATQPAGPEPIDACGVLVQGRECVLFEGGGGSYYLSNYGRFRAGDAVRVVGTVDPDCSAICSDADGCISGAEVYDPVSFPCGQPIRVPFDPCSGVMIPALAAVSLAAASAKRKCRMSNVE